MNRKSRIIFIGIVLCVIMGACALLIHNWGGGSDNGGELETVSSGMGVEVASTPAVFGLEEYEASVREARQSTVTIGCDVPEVPERMEIVSWEYMDMTDKKEYLEEVLRDNPEKKSYELKQRGGNDFHHSKKYPHLYLVFEAGNGFYINKNTDDGISKNLDFSKKQVMEKVSRILDRLSLSAEPEEQWVVEKNPQSYFTEGIEWEKDYWVKVYQAYNGFPLLSTGGYFYEDAGQNYVAISPWEFCYGDVGWMHIHLSDCMALKGTGQYVKVLTLEEAAAFLADKVGGYNITKAKLGYWYGGDHLLRPFWYVDNGSIFQDFYCIDAETGTVYGLVRGGEALGIIS